MQKISSFIPVALAGSFAVYFGITVAACGSYSSNTAASAGATAMAGAGNSPGTGGSGNSPGTGGSGNSSASAGSSNCATGTIECSAKCLDASADNANCGFCGNACPTAQTCQAGACTCAPGDTQCVPFIPGVCDVLAGSGHPCVSAHSTVRKLRSAYTGPLYQVCNGAFTPGPASCAAGMKLDIGAVAGGYADAAAQDAFCAGGTCTISFVYDQSGMKNDLEPAPKGGLKTTPDTPVKATDLKIAINGHTAYGMLLKPGNGYRTGCSGCTLKTGNGIAVGDEPESMYMVSSQKNLGTGCCFDYGNAETSSNDDGNGTMEAVYVGLGVVWGTGVDGGPWVMADLENGLYAGWDQNSASHDQHIATNTPLAYDFLTAVVVGDVATANGGKGRFALYGGDATSGPIKTMYDGIRPDKPGYVPMQKQGSIILGIGGDNSSAHGGHFYEGVMTNGVWSKATVDALQANIVAAKYGQ